VINAIRVALLSMGIMFLGVAVSLGSADSAFLDFTQIPEGQLQFFQFAFFGFFTACMLAMGYVGDS
jgi:hypothetical protein